jgi:hypothetical protein
VGLSLEGAAMLRILAYVSCYVLALAALMAVHHVLHRWNRGDADEEARREVARWKAFMPPGNENDIYERPKKRSAS